MLKRYNNFLNENLLLESIVVFSPKFTKLLRSIDSPVSKALLDMESKDFNVSNNYIDMHTDKEHITFIQDRKAQELLGPANAKKYVYYTGDGGYLKHTPANQKMFDELEYVPEGDHCYHPNTEERGQVLKIATSQTTGKTYLKVQYQGGVTVVNEENVRYEDVTNLPFERSRQPVRVGKGVNALLTQAGYKFTQAEIETFSNKYKSEWERLHDIFGNFELVSGDAIAFWYNARNYAGDRGQLSNSCMRYVSESFFQIYVKNPDVCSLLILKNDENKLRGRALVWKLESPKAGGAVITYMDRVYTHEDSDMELFREYAKTQGWYRKPQNNNDVTSYMVDPTGSRVFLGEIEVKIKDGRYSKYPYVDTLRFYCPDTGLLTADDDMSSSADFVQLDCTDGSFSNNDECDYCGGDGQVDCGECDGSHEVECSNCDGSGRTDCDECEGEGKVECSDCDGEGDVECEDCGGEGCDECESKGRKPCDECEGSGNKKCEDCSGRGWEQCDSCDGDGEVYCRYCDEGQIDCPECS